MRKTMLCLSIGALIFAWELQAQQPSVDQVIKKGNDLYKQQKYEPALAAYDEALAKDPSNGTAKFNRANTTYRMSKASEAITSFDHLAVNSSKQGEKSMAWYNKGVVLSGQKRLEESIEAYKNSLRQYPDDKEVRENLQKALLELKKKEPPPKKENEKKQQQQNKKQQPQPKMNQKDAEQKLKLLQQKEKDLQQRMQKEKTKTGGGGKKDW